MFDKVLTPLRHSLVPYVDNLQSGYHDAEKFARAKAHALVKHPPKAARMLANRYVLISLAAGACLYAANRLRRWRADHPHRTATARAQRAAAKSAKPAPRKATRAPVRAARVH